MVDSDGAFFRSQTASEMFDEHLSGPKGQQVGEAAIRFVLLREWARRIFLSGI